ncbi:hypothetical protein H4582DRAFT_1455572 [Lactarius indigo]|nr:hypothetical protein H4582DRAFT_1455572 [Lactarius indigo]
MLYSAQASSSCYPLKLGSSYSICFPPSIFIAFLIDIAPLPFAAFRHIPHLDRRQNYYPVMDAEVFELTFLGREHGHIGWASASESPFLVGWIWMNCPRALLDSPTLVVKYANLSTALPTEAQTVQFRLGNCIWLVMICGPACSAPLGQTPHVKWR